MFWRPILIKMKIRIYFHPHFRLIDRILIQQYLQIRELGKLRRFPASYKSKNISNFGINWKVNQMINKNNPKNLKTNKFMKNQIAKKVKKILVI